MKDEAVGYRTVPNRGRNRIDSLQQEYYYKPLVGDLELSSVAETPDIAIMLALGHKYEGNNSKFAQYATRMLGIDSVWSK